MFSSNSVRKAIVELLMARTNLGQISDNGLERDSCGKQSRLVSYVQSSLERVSKQFLLCLHGPVRNSWGSPQKSERQS